MPVTILMPMAGRGARFAEAGWQLPKPLIPVRGCPMFRLALASLRTTLPDANIVCVVLREHQEQFQIGARLREAEPAAEIVTIPAVTGGSLETCLAAASSIGGGALVVLDCDLTFAAPEYLARLEAMDAGHDASAGLLLSFRSSLPRYSYARVENGHVTATAEKQPISDRALIGAYGFGRGPVFLAAAADIVRRGQRTGNGEYYVSSVYNELIAQGGPVRIEDAARIWSVGTPEELAAAEADPAFHAHLRAIGLDPSADR